MTTFVPKEESILYTMQYYYYANGKQCGPVEGERLLQYGVTGNTLVWREGLKEWVEARTLPELSALFTIPNSDYAGSSVYGTHTAPNGATALPPKPETYLVWAILTTILCFLPFGIVSIVMATGVDEAYGRGDYETARRKSNNARQWAIWSAVTSAILVVGYAVVALFAALPMLFFL